MRFTPQTLAALVGLAAISLLASGCTAAPVDNAIGDPISGGTFTYASGDAEPTCLDPHVGGNYPQALVSAQYLESLVSRDTEDYRVKNGERLNVQFPVSTNQSIPAEQSVFEQIQATAKETGFAVSLTPLDISSWYGALAANEYDAVSAPYTKAGPDVLRILYHSDGIVPAPSGYFANLAQVSDPELDALLTDAGQISDPTERASLYTDAQNRVLEGFHLLPLYDQQNHFLMSSEVQGMRTLPSVSVPTLYDTWLNR